MRGRPEAGEAAPYYYTYIDQIASDDILNTLDTQFVETMALLSGISDEQSVYRYEPGKWSMRQVLNHMSDTERAFVFRAMWFARGFDSPLPGYDQEIAAAGAGADGISWDRHVEEFRAVRLGTLALFRNLPEEAWMRTGIASDNRFTVRSMAYITAGHVAHHVKVLRERYLAK